MSYLLVSEYKIKKISTPTSLFPKENNRCMQDLMSRNFGEGDGCNCFFSDIYWRFQISEMVL